MLRTKKAGKGNMECQSAKAIQKICQGGPHWEGEFLKKDDFKEVTSIAIMCRKKISERTARINALMRGNAWFVWGTANKPRHLNCGKDGESLREVMRVTCIGPWTLW